MGIIILIIKDIIIRLDQLVQELGNGNGILLAPPVVPQHNQENGGMNNNHAQLNEQQQLAALLENHRPLIVWDNHLWCEFLSNCGWFAMKKILKSFFTSLLHSVTRFNPRRLPEKTRDRVNIGVVIFLIIDMCVLSCVIFYAILVANKPNNF